jgi:hypothetical protein
MPDNVHDQTGMPSPVALPPAPPQSDYVEIVDEEEDEKARQELARISLSNAQLLELAKRNPPLPKWFDEEEEAPF